MLSKFLGGKVCSSMLYLVFSNFKLTISKQNYKWTKEHSEYPSLKIPAPLSPLLTSPWVGQVGMGRAKVGKPVFCDKDKLTGKTKAVCVK